MGSVNGGSLQIVLHKCAAIKVGLFASGMADDLRHLKIRVGKGLEKRPILSLLASGGLVRHASLGEDVCLPCF